MNRLGKKLLHIFGINLVLGAALAGAIEVAQPLDRFSIVGVIAGGRAGSDVAVLRDNNTKASITVALGGSIGSEGEYTVSKIARRRVEVTKAGKIFFLEYALPERIENKVIAEASEMNAFTNFEGNIRNYLSEMQNFEDSNLQERGNRNNFTDETSNIQPFANGTYPLLKRERRRVAEDAPAVYKVDEVAEAYRDLNSSEGQSNEFEAEMKFREKYKSLQTPIIKEAAVGDEETDAEESGTVDEGMENP